MLPVVSHHQRFRISLCFIIDPARTYRINVAGIGLVLRANQGISVYFRCGGEQETCLLRSRQPQGIVRTESADFQGLNRILEIIYGASRRGKMQHRVNHTRYVDEVANIVIDKLKFALARQVRDVILRSSD